MHRAVDKGTALTTLGNHLNVAPEAMVAFGDNLNDYEMLATVGHSYIVQAATAALEPVATARIGSNQDFAVQQQIEQILDNGGQLS